MKIGIIGSGNMGRALGVRFTRLGHDVLFGARNAAAGQAAADLAGGTARAGSNEDAARHGDVLVWTMRETDPSAVLGDPAVIDGKIVIDLNNRDYANDVQNAAWFGESIAERLQAQAPKSHVVKALNLVAMETFNTSPEQLRASGAQIFIAGAHEPAKQIVAQLAAELGFDSVDVGAGRAAFRAVEALADVLRLLMIDRGKGARANLQLRLLPEPDLQDVGRREPSAYH
jgi:predicted dinucleotide-binding enzyme